MHELTSGEQIDQFRLTEVLARTGTASIFMAIDTLSGQSVVVKAPHRKADRLALARFRQEEVVARRLTLGIDTGAVYGGKLTAAVLESLDKDAQPRLVQVKAERAWHEHPRWAGED